MDILFLLGGLAGLLVGGELLVGGAVALALKARIPPMVIGLTLVGFGTSTPELVTSIQAALAGSPGIAIGNVVGSNICNVLLILGLAALIAPIAIGRDGFRRDMTVLTVATIACTAAVLTGTLGALAGGVLVALLAGYLVWTVVPALGTPSDGTDLPASSTGIAALRFIGGLAVTLVAAHFLVRGAISISAALGVSEAVIGVTVVAVGTSLPELVTSVIAARRGQSDIAFGNVVGSNIFNILGILGATALVTPLAVPAEIARFDIWVMVAATLALIVAAFTGWRVTRGEGAAMLAAYTAYLAVLAITVEG